MDHVLGMPAGIAREKEGIVRRADRGSPLPLDQGSGRRKRAAGNR